MECMYMKHKKRNSKICLEHKSEEKKNENIIKDFFKKHKRSSWTKEKYNGTKLKRMKDGKKGFLLYN